MMAPQTTPNTPHPGELAQSIDGINTILLPLTPKDPTAVDDESYGEPPSGLTDKERDYLLKKGWSGLPSGGWKIPNKRNTGMGSLTPEEVEALIDANPGAEDLIRRKYQQEKKSVEGFPLV